MYNKINIISKARQRIVVPEKKSVTKINPKCSNDFSHDLFTKTSVYRQPDNTQNTTKPEDTHAPRRKNQDQVIRIGKGRMEIGIQLDKGTRGVARE